MIKKLLLTGLLMSFSFGAKAQAIPPLEDVIDEVNPAVVNVVAELKDGEKALGAGIIIEAEGYIVTNAHVTEGAKKIYVLFSDGRQYPALAVGNDEKTDIALLKVEHSEGFITADFADSDEVRVGNTVFAIGNPFGLGNSVSLGIISAKERDIEKGPYDNFLQTDATINQGNSGGPLFNREGKIVGINTAIFSLDGQYAGIGFATPSNTVKWVAQQIKQKGKVERGWLGFSVQRVAEKGENGNYVLAVDSLNENSPAAKGGLMVGDIIQEFGEIELKNPRIFSLEVSKMPIGTQIPAVIKRDDKILDLSFEVALMPDEKASKMSDVELGLESKTEEEKRLKNFAELGIDNTQIINAVDFEQIGIKAYFEEKNREFVVVEVKPKSDAYNKGLKVGDKIIAVNDTKPFGAEDFSVKLKNAARIGKIELDVLSGTKAYSLNLKIGHNNEQN